MDREAHLRQDPAWFSGALADPRSRAIAVWNLPQPRIRIIRTTAPFSLELSALPAGRLNADDLILLGRFSDVNYFALELESVDPRS